MYNLKRTQVFLSLLVQSSLALQVYGYRPIDLLSSTSPSLANSSGVFRFAAPIRPAQSCMICSSCSSLFLIPYCKEKEVLRRGGACRRKQLDGYSS